MSTLGNASVYLAAHSGCTQPPTEIIWQLVRELKDAQGRITRISKLSHEINYEAFYEGGGSGR